MTLVTGKTALSRPLFVDTVEITTAREMYEAVTERYEQQDIVIRRPPWQIIVPEK